MSASSSTGGYVVHDTRSETGNHPFRHTRPESIDRDRHLRILVADDLHGERHPAQLLRRRYVGRPRPRRITAHVDYRSALGNGLVDTFPDSPDLRCPAAGEKRIRRHIDNGHHHRPLQVEQPAPYSYRFHHDYCINQSTFPYRPFTAGRHQTGHRAAIPVPTADAFRH